MARDQIRTFLDGFVSAWQRHDIPTLARCYTDDCEIVSPIFGTVTGREAVEGSFREVFKAFADITIRVDDLVIDGDADRAVSLWTARSTHKGPIFGMAATGKAVEVTMVFLLTFRDGQIAREVRMYDLTRLLLELGVLRAKPA
jgi:steroid delta-isomerase-like uncharacterized protein